MTGLPGKSIVLGKNMMILLVRKKMFEHKDGYITMTDELWKLMKTVNKKANKIKYKTDLQAYNQLDLWTSEMDKLGYGDCDDYMLYKKRLLQEEGVPWQGLVPATCVAGGGGHAVLLIRTSEGNYILDNNLDHIPKKENYTFERKPVEWLDYYEPLEKCWYGF